MEFEKTNSSSLIWFSKLTFDILMRKDDLEVFSRSLTRMIKIQQLTAQFWSANAIENQIRLEWIGFLKFHFLAPCVRLHLLKLSLGSFTNYVNTILEFFTPPSPLWTEREHFEYPPLKTTWTFEVLPPFHMIFFTLFSKKW